MKKKMKALAVCGLMAALLLASVTAVAADSTDTGTGSVTGSVGVTGNIQPITISITHPITEAYTVDPNTSTVTTPEISLTNNTKVPISVTVQSLASTGGFTDVGPNDKDWANLSAEDSKKYIALGATISDASGWDSGYYTGTDWAAAGTPVTFGSLASGSTGKIALSIKSGLAFDTSVTAQHEIVFTFSLV